MSFQDGILKSSKPEYKKPVDRITYDATISIFDKLLQIIHPFMPFITEEIWHAHWSNRKDGESLMVSRMPEVKKFNKDLIAGLVCKGDSKCNTDSKKRERDPE